MRSRIRPFVKFVNYAHIMPTRYVLGAELDLKNLVKDEDLLYRLNVIYA